MILQKAVADGTLNLDDVQQRSEMKERTEILKKHKYAITQGKDGKWRTYVPDASRERGRRQIKKSTQKSLEDEIVAYYRKLERKDELTLETLYPEWLKYYSLHVNADGTVKRVTSIWKKFYKEDKLVKQSISSFTKVQLDVWVHDMIKTHEMSKKDYYRTSLIIRQMLAYALEAGYISQNPFAKVTVNSKVFQKEKKPVNETQVYRLEEEIAIVDEALKDYERKPEVTTPLAVILLFYLGLRVGEVVALKDTDIHENVIEVGRMERRIFETDDGLEYHQVGRSVEDCTKTPAGLRRIPVIKEAMEIINLILEVDHQQGYERDFYLFMENGKRKPDSAVRWRLKKYCKNLGIPYKSPHKIRKTYISKLIDSGISINTIREYAGHVDERTTYHNYCFDRKTFDQNYQLLENELNIPSQYKVQSNVIQFVPKEEGEKVIKGNQILPA